jgi:hypothetical protein
MDEKSKLTIHDALNPKNQWVNVEKSKLTIHEPK